MWRCAMGGPLPYKASTPDQGADWIGFPILEIFSKGKEITFLTISKCYNAWWEGLFANCATTVGYTSFGSYACLHACMNRGY
jgi:hypothetical protein